MNASTQKSIIRDNSLSTNARFLYVLIDSYANKDGSNAFPSHKTMCELSGRDRKWVMRALDELEKKGWLTRKLRMSQRGRRSNEYTLAKCPIPAPSLSAQNGTLLSAQNGHKTSVSITRDPKHPPLKPRNGSLKTGLPHYGPIDERMA